MQSAPSGGVTLTFTSPGCTFENATMPIAPGKMVSPKLAPVLVSTRLPVLAVQVRGCTDGRSEVVVVDADHDHACTVLDGGAEHRGDAGHERLRRHEGDVGEVFAPVGPNSR